MRATRRRRLSRRCLRSRSGLGSPRWRALRFRGCCLLFRGRFWRTDGNLRQSNRRRTAWLSGRRRLCRRRWGGRCRFCLLGSCAVHAEERDGDSKGQTGASAHDWSFARKGEGPRLSPLDARNSACVTAKVPRNFVEIDQASIGGARARKAWRTRPATITVVTMPAFKTPARFGSASVGGKGSDEEKRNAVVLQIRQSSSLW